MKQFSFFRYAMILRWDVVNSWRKMLNITLIMATALFLMEYALLPKPFYGDIDPIETHMYEACFSLVAMAMSFMLLFGSTSILLDMRTKQERISVLMLPGTNLEKFLSKLTRSLVLFFLMTIVAFVVADLARMLIGALFHRVTSDSMIPYFWNGIWSEWLNFHTHSQAEAAVLMISIWLVSLSIGTLGGVIFNRNPFVMTGISVFAISIFLGIIVSSISLEHWEDIANILQNPSGWPFVAFNLVVFALLMYLSYRLFCRIQAVNNKFLNL